VGGGTVVTVTVAQPNVDADGSVYDIAEITQVRTHSHTHKLSHTHTHTHITSHLSRQ
jgi:hypothetical protein